MGDIKIGFSMHPRWVSGAGLKAFTDPLRAGGLSVLEFELDDHLDLWEEFGPLMAESVDNGFDLCFHAPYRAPHNLAGFACGRRTEIEQDYCPLLNIAAEWAQRTGSPKTVVIHAAVGAANASQVELVADTVEFLGMALDAYPDLRFALENNHPPKKDQIKVGVRRENVLKIISQINHAHLHVCWDMGHDYLSGSRGEVEPAWLDKVSHVHIHDVDADGTDHYPLVYGNVPYLPWLRALRQARMKGAVVLELKGDLLRGWENEGILVALTGSVRAIAREIE